MLHNIDRYWRFTRDLTSFLQNRLSVEMARELLYARLETRDSSFLQMVERSIFNNPKSPYLKLLRMIGCEYGDIKQMTESDGVEKTMEKLKDAGVYITIEEFKGKKECRRGSAVHYFEETDFDNLINVGYLSVTSSASRSGGTRSLYDLDFLAANISTYNVPALIGLDALEFPIALWMPSMPGAGVINLLGYSKLGSPPVKWFSPLGAAESSNSLKDRLTAKFVIQMGRMAGIRWPSPEHVSYDNAIEVVRWISNMVKKYGGCLVDSYVSAVLRICRTARENGIDISGIRFIMGGEPLTDVKLNEIKSVTSKYCILYGIAEAGFIGAGCFDPDYSDDIHVFEDAFSLIQYKRIVPHANIEVDAFLLTSFLPSAPKILLNMEVGDHGSVDVRNCKCVFNQFGFKKHIHHVRGFDKISSEGTTFLAGDLVRIIEQILPDKFGGSSTDYQVVEEEDEKGNTRIHIAVSPDLGNLDEADLVRTILLELGRDNEAAKMMTKIWDQARTLQVKRIKPVITSTGKLLPLHIIKQPRNRSAL